ncbi:hypothetical protein [Algibacillus agarilyticus]|uniref:hypothetical protein n=1 Tax=Algibacillus agarilyticus TaxID=2234133 RepID=UPI000DD0B921|nr:hypothetical protein [Algibacillus agarilyticus]
MKMKYITFLFLLTVAYSTVAKTVITFATGAPGDPTDLYEYKVLKLALDKTIDTHGNYRLDIRPGSVLPTFTRLRMEAENNEYKNLVYKDSVSNEIMESLKGIEFPVELGAIGYRLGLISKESKAKIRQINTKQQATNLTMIQGRGWLDGDILKSQGFNVVFGRNIEGLFYMAANNRADMFPVGSSELKSAWDQFKYVEGLDYDREICIYYPLPKFFFTHPSNLPAANRIQSGLVAAYESGELFDLWKSFYAEKMAFANLKDRKIFKYKNPMISQIDDSYEQYILDPKLL